MSQTFSISELFNNQSTLKGKYFSCSNKKALLEKNRDYATKLWNGPLDSVDPKDSLGRYLIYFADEKFDQTDDRGSPVSAFYVLEEFDNVKIFHNETI